MRCALRALGVRWGCIASADGASFVVRAAGGDRSVAIADERAFFPHVRSAGALDELVVAGRERAAAFGEAGLVDFSPGLLIGARLGADDVLVVADPAERVLDADESAALLDVVCTARALVATDDRAEVLSAQLFDGAPDAMVVVAGDGRIVQANAAAQKLLGYQAIELFALTIEDLVPLAVRARHAGWRAAFSAAPSGRPMGKRANMAAVRRDGAEIPVDIMLGPFALDGEAYVLAVVRDMTARRDSLAALRSSEEELRQAQRLELLGKFASSIAHDFGNLLTVVSSCSELMMNDPSFPPTMREEIVDVRTASERGKLLTRQLLAFARRDASQRRAVVLADLCERLRSLLQRLIGPPYALDVSVAHDVGQVFADPVHVEQILMNLVVNARDAMPSGGTIALVAKRVEIGSDEPDVSSGVYAALEVTDSGSGIAPDVLSRIFEPLFTTKPAERGSGLGLAIVERVVKENGGHVRVETEVGRGSTFTVLLPQLAG